MLSLLMEQRRCPCPVFAIRPRGLCELRAVAGRRWFGSERARIGSWVVSRRKWMLGGLPGEQGGRALSPLMEQRRYPYPVFAIRPRAMRIEGGCWQEVVRLRACADRELGGVSAQVDVGWFAR